MPTFLSAFASSEIAIKYHEPYVSQSLNAKAAVMLPPGTYRGFRLKASVTNYTLTVQADPDNGDHVAVYEVGAGTVGAQRYSVTIRRATADFDINVVTAGFPLSTSGHVCIYATYALGATTVAEIRIYTDAEWALLTTAQQAELIVLGRLTTPGAPGVLTVTSDKRTPAWMKIASEGVQWSPMIANGGFEWGLDATTDVNKLVPPWVCSNTGQGRWRRDTTNQRSGTACLKYITLATGAATGTVEQLVGLPVCPDKLVKVRFWKQQRTTLLSASFSVVVYFRTSAGGSLTEVINWPTVLAGVTWNEIEHTFRVPAGADLLSSVRIVIAGGSLISGADPAYLIDDFQVWVEGVNSEAPGAHPSIRRPVETHQVALTDPGTIFGDYDAWLDNQGSNEIWLHRPDWIEGMNQPGLWISGLIAPGQFLYGDDATSLTPRIEFGSYTDPADSELTLLWWSWGVTVGSGGYSRAYLDNTTGEMFFTQNAVCNSTLPITWERDVLGIPASKWVFGNQGLSIYTRNGAGTWNNTIGAAGWEKTNLTSLWDGTNPRTTLGGQLYDLGKDLLGSAPDQIKSRIQIPTAGASGAVIEQLLEVLGSGVSGARVGVWPPNGDFHVTINAYMTAAGNWQRDIATDSLDFIFYKAGISIRYITTAVGAPWADGSWTTICTLDGSTLQMGWSGQINALGSGLVGSAPNAIKGRITTISAPTATSAYTLLWESASASDARKGRWYINANGGSLVWTYNAGFTAAGQWARDTAGEATRVDHGPNKTLYHYPAASASPWADGAWTTKCNFDLANNEVDLKKPVQLAWPDSRTTAIPAEMNTPLIHTRGSGTNGYFVLIQEDDGTTWGGASPHRIYMGYSGEQWETWNCYFDNADGLWHSSNTSWYCWARRTTRFSGSLEGFTHVVKQNGVASWANTIDGGVTGWRLAFCAQDEGVIRLGGYQVTGYGNPDYGSAVYGNALYSKSLVKAWGYAISNGAGGFTIRQGFGCDITISGFSMICTFKAAMTADDYAVVFGTYNTPPNYPWHCDVGTTLAASFYIRFWTNAATPVQLDASTVSLGVMFAVFGEQQTTP